MGARHRDARVSRAERHQRAQQQRNAGLSFEILFAIANTPDNSEAYELASSSLDEIISIGTLNIKVWVRCCPVLRSVEDGEVYEVAANPTANDCPFVLYALTELARWKRLRDVRRCIRCARFFLRSQTSRSYCSSTCQCSAKSRRDTEKNRNLFGLSTAVDGVQMTSHIDPPADRHSMIDTTTTTTTTTIADYAARIRAARLDLELSKAELARMSGVPRGFIGQLERGLTPTSLVPIERLARALGLKL